jgi:hypothetical protein
MRHEPASKIGQKRNSMVLSPISKAVRPVVRRFLPQKSVLFQQLFDIWPELVKNSEAEGTIPEKLALARDKQKDAILYLWSQTGAQAMEISFNKQHLISRINTVFGYALMVDLRVTAFPTTANKNTTATAKAAKRDSIPCQSLDKILTEISNPDLRAALRDFGGVLPSNTTDKG